MTHGNQVKEPFELVALLVPNNPGIRAIPWLVSVTAFLSTVPFSAAGPPVPGASFQGLGDLPGGGFRSEATAISADGSTVVGVSLSAGGSEAFRWTLDGGMIAIGDLPGGDYDSRALDASADGAVVVGHAKSSLGTEAFVWTAESGMVTLGDLPGGIFQSVAAGVSDDGLVVAGSSRSSSGTEAFRWTLADGMIGLGDIPGGNFGSGATDVSADGRTVVGNATSVDGTEAFRWTEAGGLIGLGDFPGLHHASEATGVSADGAVIVGIGQSFLGEKEAFRWTAETDLVGLGDPHEFITFSSAHAASANGNVIVGSGFGPLAFIWNPNEGMRVLQDVLENDFGLDLDGWVLTEATAISADGTVIAGYGSNPQFVEEAWIARLPKCLAADGDFDFDGNLDAIDGAAFALALVAPGVYAEQHDPCGLLHVDLNEDGHQDGHDIAEFIELILPG